MSRAPSERDDPNRPLASRTPIAAQDQAEVPSLQRHLLQAALVHAGLGTWTWNMATDEVSYDSSFFAIYGVTPTGDVKVDRQAAAECIVPGDRVAVRQAVERAGREGQPTRIRIRAHRANDGAPRDIEVSSLPVDAAGGTMLVGIIQDVTDQVATLVGMREAQTQAHAISDAIPDMVLRIRNDGLILEFKPAIGSQATREMFVGQNMLEASPAPNEFSKGLLAAIRKVIADGKLISMEVTTNLPRWREGTFECRILRCASDQALVLVRDITEQRQAEQAEANARKRAEEAVATRTAFLATLSHEMRTPLNGVVGLARALSHTELTEPQSAYVNGIAASGRALLALVDDLLDLTRIESGRLELRPAPTMLRELLDEVAAILQAQTQERGLELVLELDGVGDEPVLIDGDRLRQVLLNLVGNAIKFTDDGQVLLRAHMLDHQVDAHRGTLQFTVRDTGIGVAPADQERIFEPFVQADATTARRRGGTGLGLSISREIVERMNGRLTMRSEPGIGTTVEVSIPVAIEPVWASITSQDFADARSDLAVLLVEDNAINQMVAREQLQGLGVKTLQVVDTAEDALTLLDERPFDLVLMDLQLPGIDGYEACRRLRAGGGINSGCVVVALTAHAVDGDDARCRAAGMDGHLVKPSDAMAVANWLESAKRRSAGLD